MVDRDRWDTENGSGNSQWDKKYPTKDKYDHDFSERLNRIGGIGGSGSSKTIRDYDSNEDPSRNNY